MIVLGGNNWRVVITWRTLGLGFVVASATHPVTRRKGISFELNLPFVEAQFVVPL